MTTAAPSSTSTVCTSFETIQYISAVVEASNIYTIVSEVSTSTEVIVSIFTEYEPTSVKTAVETSTVDPKIQKRSTPRKKRTLIIT